MGQRGLLALDVDGTIVSYDDELSPAVRDVVLEVLDAGWHVVLATGRSLHATLPVHAALGLADGLAVCSNGAVVADVATGEVLHADTFDADATIRTIVEAVPDALLAVEVLGVGFRVTGDFPAGELSGRIEVVPHEELLDGPITRLVVRGPDGSRQDFLELAERLGAHGVSYAVGYTAWLDVMPPQVSKASGLERVREALGVDPAATVAVGDGANDLEMLAWAARSVAMGQAFPEVVAAADELTGSVDDDGLVPVLRSLLP